MGRAPCCDKASVKRGPWSPEEDLVLRSYVEKHGTGGNWIALPQKAGLKLCGKSCRLRWLNYLRPDIKHGGFTEEEDNVICSLYKAIGSRWAVIASHLPGRIDNDVKNRWNTKLKKKLLMPGDKADAGATSSSTQNSLSRRSPSLSTTSACNGPSPSALRLAADYGFGFSEPGSSPAPADPLQPLPPFLEAASSSLAMDYGSSYAPWCDSGGAEFDAFLMDVGMGTNTMEFFPGPGGYGVGELGHGEAGMAGLWSNSHGSAQGTCQSVTYW